MPSVAAVLAGLAVRAPGDKAADWDPHGLQIGDPDAEATRPAVCHEVTERVVGDAIAAGVDLLISYHPLLFRPSNRMLAGPGPWGRAYRLVRSGVAVAVVHTAWDVTPGGTSDALADELGLREVRGFGALEGPEQLKLVTFVPPADVDRVAMALSVVGAGRIGNYSGCSFRSPGVGTFFPEAGAAPVSGRPGHMNEESEVRLEMVLARGIEEHAIAALIESHPYEEPAYDIHEVRSNRGLIGRVGELAGPIAFGEFASAVDAALGSTARVSGERGRMVERVAVLPGSGGSHVGAAAASGADAFVTGDLGHHQTREATDRGLSTIDPGHAATERPGVARLLTLARAIVPGTVDLTHDPTPWKEG